MKKKERIGGYVYGNYTCRCKFCSKEFTGDKRSYSCKPCAIHERDKKQLVLLGEISSGEAISILKRCGTVYTNGHTNDYVTAYTFDGYNIKTAKLTSNYDLSKVYDWDTKLILFSSVISTTFYVHIIKIEDGWSTS